MPRNLIRFINLIPIVAAAFMLVARTASAAITVYPSRVEWAAVVGAHKTEDFEGATELTRIPLTGGVLLTENFDIVVDQNHGRIGLAQDGFFEFPTPGVSGTFFVGDVHDSSISHPYFNTIEFHKPITAFAGNFAALEDGGVRAIMIAGESFEVRAAS